MKKIAILTSILALTACGGGGGSGGSADGRVRPFDSERIVSNQTYNSNRNVTSMVSRLLIARDGSGRTLARSGSTDFPGYDEFDLSDVSFNLADEGFGGVVRFGVDDNKKIINFSLIDDDTGFTIIDNNVWTETENGEVYLDGNTLQTHNTGGGEFEYDSDTGIYTYTSNNEGMNGTFKIVDGEILELYEGEEFGHDAQNHVVSNDPSIKIIDGKVYSYATFTRTADDSFTFGGTITVEGGEEADATLTYVSSGKNVPLRYSDFGYFELLTEDENENRPVSIIGGYDIKKIDHENLPATDNEIVFSGGASGSVVALRDGAAHTLELNDNDAELTFANGTSTLNASFNNWYDIEYSETYAANGTATNRTITYSNYNDSTTDRNNNPVSENYFRMLSDTMGDEFTMTSVENSEQHGSNIDTFDSIQSDVRFYGDNGNPSEVVGLIQVRDCAGNQCGDVMGNRNDEVRMNIGFGGRHDIPTTNPRRD